MIPLCSAHTDGFTRTCIGYANLTFSGFFALLVLNLESMFSVGVFNLFCGVCQEILHLSKEVSGHRWKKGGGEKATNFWRILAGYPGVCPASTVGVILYMMPKIKITTKQFGMGLYLSQFIQEDA